MTTTTDPTQPKETVDKRLEEIYQYVKGLYVGGMPDWKLEEECQFKVRHYKEGFNDAKAGDISNIGSQLIAYLNKINREL